MEGTMAKSTLNNLRRRIRQHRKEGWIAGVCAGLANYFDTDPAFVRVAPLLSALFLPPLPITAYLIAWLVLDDDKRVSPLD